MLSGVHKALASLSPEPGKVSRKDRQQIYRRQATNWLTHAPAYVSDDDNPDAVWTAGDRPRGVFSTHLSTPVSDAAAWQARQQYQEQHHQAMLAAEILLKTWDISGPPSRSVEQRAEGTKGLSSISKWLAQLPRRNNTVRFDSQLNRRRPQTGFHLKPEPHKRPSTHAGTRRLQVVHIIISWGLSD